MRMKLLTWRPPAVVDTIPELIVTALSPVELLATLPPSTTCILPVVAASFSP